MSIINKVASFVTQAYYDQMEEIINAPHSAQEKEFSLLIENGKKTEYGLTHHFNEIKNYQTFQEKVPVVTYEEIQPEIERARRGKENILWPGICHFFAKSSGTTNAKSKFIPITKQSLESNHFTCGKMLFANYLRNHPDTVIFKRKNLRIGGSAELYQEYKTKYGDLSAIMIDNLPFWTDFMNTPNREISLMSDWDVKLDAIANVVINESVGSLTGVPSWMLVLLNRCLEITGKEKLDEIWPDVEVFFHGGISFKPYQTNYADLCRKELRHYEIYNASEGFFAFQDQKDSKDLLLLLNVGVFYEFIPMEGSAMHERKAVPLSDVEVGKNYAIVISSNGGLWRYMIGDTVKFVSVNPYRIVVSGRTKHYINAFGEEVIIENVEDALKVAAEATEAKINEFTGAPIFMKDKEKGAHEYIIEFEKLPENFEAFKNIFDDRLKEINSDYEAKRYNNMTLNAPNIHIARESLFYDWMKERGKLGGQNKVPRLCNDRQFIEPLLRLNETKTSS